VRVITDVLLKLAARLEHARLMITTRNDPCVAIADIEREPIDAVICDLRMPLIACGPGTA
jgi:DNA-binding NarL/FixJ family response regulator